jgi:hypothetical protein
MVAVQGPDADHPLYIHIYMKFLHSFTSQVDEIEEYDVIMWAYLNIPT